MAEIRDLREERGDYLIAEALETIADRIRNDDEFNPDTIVCAYMDGENIGVTGDGSPLAQIGLIEVVKAQILNAGFSEE